MPQKVSIKIKTRKLATQIQVDKVSVYQYLNFKQLQKDRVLCNYNITLIQGFTWKKYELIWNWLLRRELANFQYKEKRTLQGTKIEELSNTISLVANSTTTPLDIFICYIFWSLIFMFKSAIEIVCLSQHIFSVVGKTVFFIRQEVIKLTTAKTERRDQLNLLLLLSIALVLLLC